MIRRLSQFLIVVVKIIVINGTLSLSLSFSLFIFLLQNNRNENDDDDEIMMMMTEKSKSPNPKYEADVKHVFLGLIIRSARTSGFDRFCVKYIWTIIEAGAAIINNAGNIYHIIKMMIIVDWLFTKQMRIWKSPFDFGRGYFHTCLLMTEHKERWQPGTLSIHLDVERTKVISPGFLMKKHVELSSSSFQMLQMRAERCQLEKAVSTFLGRLAKWAGRRCFMGAIPIPILLQYCWWPRRRLTKRQIQRHTDKYKVLPIPKGHIVAKSDLNSTDAYFATKN